MEKICFRKHPRHTSAQYPECNEKAILFIFLFSSFFVIVANLSISLIMNIVPLDELFVTWYWYIMYWISDKN